jgi:hypothetical protein
MMEYFTKHNRSETDQALMYCLAWYYVSVAREAINRAVQEVGWDRIGGPAIKDQLVKMKDFVAIGKGFAPFSYTEKRRSPSALRVHQIREGKYVPITDWRDAPDLRPAEYK